MMRASMRRPLSSLLITPVTMYCALRRLAAFPVPAGSVKPDESRVFSSIRDFSSCLSTTEMSVCRDNSAAKKASIFRPQESMYMRSVSFLNSPMATVTAWPAESGGMQEPARIMGIRTALLMFIRKSVWWSRLCANPVFTHVLRCPGCFLPSRTGPGYGCLSWNDACFYRPIPRRMRCGPSSSSKVLP